MTHGDKLLDRIVAYCERNGIAESTFGLRAIRDAKLVKEMRQGRSVTLRTLERIETVLSGEKEPAQ